jgi:L-threonylcarbamoyladenylate synthase
MTEAAANLFDLLHDLDRLGLSRIRAEEAPETGLGAAINDRLRRAAADSSPDLTSPET